MTLSHRCLLARAALALIAIAAGVALGMPQAARAQLGQQGDAGYVGPAFLQIADVRGTAREPHHKNWIRIEGHYWKVPRPERVPSLTGAGSQVPARPPAQANVTAREGAAAAAPRGFDPVRASFRLPRAPRNGAGELVVAMDKRNPALPAMMSKCRTGAAIGSLDFAVSADRSRGGMTMGARPAQVPEFIEFRLSGVRLTHCPVAAGASQQAFVVRFDDIAWTNWRDETRELRTVMQPAVLTEEAAPSGATKAWVLSWFGVAHHVGEDQCPVKHARPSTDAYFAYLTPEEAARERAALAGQGGPNYENGQMSLRGPGRLNVALLPGIVPDPGMPEPRPGTARGLNLDGDNGRKFKHRNYVSPDGKVTGIDNQLYTAEGCIAGWQGHKGFIIQFANSQMRDGDRAMLIEVSGIDNEQNDEEVTITWSTSLDPMKKNSSGTLVLADYSFNKTSDPRFTPFFRRVRARIVDGVIISDRVKEFGLNLGYTGFPSVLKLMDAGIRLEVMPDGSLRGVLGGYRDWHEISTTYISSTSEFYHGFQQPALYNALKRNADGLKDPDTGEFMAISTAYDIEGVPAFALPPQ